MKALIPNAVVLLIFYMTGITVHSQEVIHEQEFRGFHKNFIGLTLTELPFIDFRIFYERRITPAHGIILSSGYKIAFKGFTDATEVDLGQNPTAWCYRNTATWLYFAVGYRYYFNKNKTLYVSPELFYKYMWADTIVYTFGIGPNGNTLTNQYEVRSMVTSLGGLNLLIGKKLRIRFSEGFNMGLDIYSGLTVRYKLLKTTIFGSKTASRFHDEGVSTISIPLSENPAITNENLLQFSIQFGINLFFSWL